MVNFNDYYKQLGINTAVVNYVKKTRLHSINILDAFYYLDFITPKTPYGAYVSCLKKTIESNTNCKVTTFGFLPLDDEPHCYDSKYTKRKRMDLVIDPMGAITDNYLRSGACSMYVSRKKPERN